MNISIQVTTGDFTLISSGTLLTVNGDRVRFIIGSCLRTALPDRILDRDPTIEIRPSKRQRNHHIGTRLF